MPAKDYFSFAVVNFLSDCTELTLCFRMSSACHRVLLSPKKIVSIFLVAHGVKGIDCKFLTGYFKSAKGWGWGLLDSAVFITERVILFCNHTWYKAFFPSLWPSVIVRPVTTAPSDWQENVLGVVLSRDDAFRKWCSIKEGVVLRVLLEYIHFEFWGSLSQLYLHAFRLLESWGWSHCGMGKMIRDGLFKQWYHYFPWRYHCLIISKQSNITYCIWLLSIVHEIVLDLKELNRDAFC